jgi:GT2 family glycosyltransferase
MTDVLAICTRNRPIDLERCLKSVIVQVRKPSYIFVVDSSTDKQSEEITQRFSREVRGSEIRYIRSEERGLVMARNVALANLPQNAEVIHFIDDDTELDPGYVAEINRALMPPGRYVGAGGLVGGAGRKTSNKILNFLLLDSDSLGCVLNSGINIGSYDSTANLSMEWLPGCSMSFVVERIKGLEFDERRALWPLGEDVDFGLKASARGPLVHVPTASLFHHLSPTNRDEELTIVFQDVVHRWTLAKDGLGRVRKFWVFTSTIGLISIYLIYATRNLDRQWLRKARSAAKGLWVSMFLGGLKASR